jgi:hypothetical protein
VACAHQPADARIADGIASASGKALVAGYDLATQPVGDRLDQAIAQLTWPPISRDPACNAPRLVQVR